MPPAIQLFLQRLANIAIGSTTLRNQGAPGVISAARDFLSTVHIEKFISDEEASFQKQLDVHTEEMRLGFPRGAQNWGAARKAINLFLGEAYYNRFVCTHYQLQRVEKFLEVPLDTQVAYWLTSKAETMGVKLPLFTGLKYVTPAESSRYQHFAKDYAETLGDDWARIHLDVVIWRRTITDLALHLSEVVDPEAYLCLFFSFSPKH